MSSLQSKTVYLKNYTAPEYLIDKTELHFDLSAEDTYVKSCLSVRRNPVCNKNNPPLTLHGEELTLVSISINGIEVDAADYQLNAETLTISPPDEQFLLEITNRVNPKNNTALNGLYVSNDMLCTQCEAEGFRRITWYPDRPDVMSSYTVTIVADKTTYPVLLSNGNRTDSGELDNNKHWVTWNDPFPKPCYLFALVAGDLCCLKDSFTTCSKREIALEIYVEEQDIDKCEHAMQSLINAMAWDEKAFGREYDLDLYMIVAVSHFNMGAMENKGLNVFNTKFVLASKKTATDMDYENIEAVIGHEYFHNWSGNRVTCRDWFQLSLKEGFTVFRDQQFTAHQTSAAVKRILDVNMLRTHQFAEDGGPLSHPIRPSSYIEINNFYTLTVYEKGAEVVRMLHTLVGEDGFRKGTDLYFDRHDGQAVTTEDFVKAMEDANNMDFTQFKNWYDQAGTPTIEASSHYDANTQQFTLTMQQHCPATPGQANKKPFHIPVELGLLDESGKGIELSNEQGEATFSVVLELKQDKQEFIFNNIKSQPTPSLLRGFSAPVKLQQDLSHSQHLHLYQHDSDPFNRWEAGQNYLSQLVFEYVDAIQNGSSMPTLNPQLVDIYRSILTTNDKHTDPSSADLSYQSLLLTLPDKAYLAEQMEIIDVDAIYQAHKLVKSALAQALQPLWLANYHSHHKPEAGKSNTDVSQRRFKNVCLDYLMALNDTEATGVCIQQYESAQNMTDQLAALSQLSHADSALSAPYFDSFYQQWKHESLVIDKWFTLQASSTSENALERIKELCQHPDFDLKTPNRVRSLIGAFANINMLRFNQKDGSGYKFVASYIVKLDAINPQIAARLAGTLSRWKRFDKNRQELIKTQLQYIQSRPSISKDLLEVILKSLQV